MSTSKLLYLASPYSSPSCKVMKTRYRAAITAVAALTIRGHLVISPIAHTHPVVKHYPELAGSWKQWEKLDLALLDRCDELIVLGIDGWKESKGVTAEIHHFLIHHAKPVYLVSPESEYQFTPLSQEFLSLLQIEVAAQSCLDEVYEEMAMKGEQP